MTEAAAERDASRVEESTWARALARSGFVASGVVQALVGILAVQVALQGGGKETDQSGALKALAQAPGGALVVWLVALGGIALALWLILDGTLKHDRDAKQRWKQRLTSWGMAVVYAAIGVTGLRVALGAGSSSSQSTKKGSATLLSMPGGQVLLVIAGLVVVGIGGYLVFSGLAKRFVKSIHVPAGSAGRAVVVLGQVGYAARGVAIAVVGVLLVVAAVKTDPGDASGLDGALRTFADLPFGRVVLVVVGLGWIASGVYSGARGRLARLD